MTQNAELMYRYRRAYKEANGREVDVTYRPDGWYVIHDEDHRKFPVRESKLQAMCEILERRARQCAQTL